MTPQPSAERFDRDEISAIIGRAAEVTHRDQPFDDRLGLEELVAIADEVGLSRSAVTTALAESRAGVVHSRRSLDRLVGPRQIWSISQLSTSQQDTIASLEHWLEIDHGLHTHVRSNGVVVAQPKSGLTGAVSATLRRLGGGGGLDRARRVQGATAAVGELGSVCLVADVGNKRGEAVAGGAAVAGSTGVVIAAAALLTSPFAFLGMPIGALAGIAVARAVHRRHAEAVTAQLELTTEAVVRGQTPVHPVERFVRTRLVRRPKSLRQADSPLTNLSR